MAGTGDPNRNCRRDDRFGTTPRVALLAEQMYDGRSRRVLLLVIGIVLLSMGDLAVTVAFLQAQWMMEANPIAAALIRSTQSPWALAAFKAASVGICVAVLLRLRRHALCEIAAWAGMAILSATALMWSSYAGHFDDPAESMMLVQLGSCSEPLSLPY